MTDLTSFLGDPAAGAAGAPANVLEALGLPTLSCLLRPQDTASLFATCTALQQGDPEAVWRNVCVSAAITYGLYVPLSCRSWRRLFFEHLWPARGKWGDGPTPHVAFSVQVCVRFRPGDRGAGKLQLPLHQRLKIHTSEDPIVDKEPPEFLDALMNTRMSQPVLLPDSQKVMDRAVILMHLSRSSTDPFTGRSLRPDQLQPLPALQSRIEEWRAGLPESRRDVGVGMSSEVLTKLGGEALTPALMTALLEAEALSLATKRASAERVRRRRFRVAGVGGVLPLDEVGDVGEEDLDLWAHGEDDADPSGGGGSAGAGAGAGGDPGGPWRTEGSGGPGPREAPDPLDVADKENGRTKETARVLATQDSRVLTFIPGAGVRPFVFTRVFDGVSGQRDVFEETARRSVIDVLNGFSAVTLAYGQTGSGKTHTMFGPDGSLEALRGRVWDERDPVCANAGVAVRAIAELLTARLANPEVKVTFRLKYLEIYNDELMCLLTGRRVRLMMAAGEPTLVGCHEVPVASFEDALDLLKVGDSRKRRAETAMNKRSSRAHTVLVLTASHSMRGRMTTSSLHLVDLAGSERIKKSRVTGVRRDEAVGINESLLVLGKCVAALVQESSHVPYYESKLTLLLKAAFGGNSRTTLVVNCRGDDAHGDETLQSLRFGERCGMISNHTVQASASMASAMAAVNAALEGCLAQMQRLEEASRQHLPVYASLRSKFEALDRHRREILSLQGHAAPTHAAGGSGHAVATA